MLAGPAGERREVKARDFFEAAFFTKLAGDEILTGDPHPAPPAGHGWAYEKQKRKIGDYATAAAAVMLTLTGGTCASAAIALTNVGADAAIAEAAAQALVGTAVDDAAIDAAAQRPPGDHRSGGRQARARRVPRHRRRRDDAPRAATGAQPAPAVDGGAGTMAKMHVKLTVNGSARSRRWSSRASC